MKGKIAFGALAAALLLSGCDKAKEVAGMDSGDQKFGQTLNSMADALTFVEKVNSDQKFCASQTLKASMMATTVQHVGSIADKMHSRKAGEQLEAGTLVIDGMKPTKAQIDKFIDLFGKFQTAWPTAAELMSRPDDSC